MSCCTHTSQIPCLSMACHGVSVQTMGKKHECMIGGSDAKESVEHQSYLHKTKTRHIPS